MRHINSKEAGEERRTGFEKKSEQKEEVAKLKVTAHSRIHTQPRRREGVKWFLLNGLAVQCT